MGYLATGGLTAEQQVALTLAPVELTELDTETRAGLLFRHQELEARKKEAFWTALQVFATTALPVAAFLGLTSWFKRS